jgi:hypothetical protein
MEHLFTWLSTLNEALLSESVIRISNLGLLYVKQSGLLLSNG